ncbi:secreted RxLR effector peptide protein, putative [Phytophthora infestans T30-4]|uniref:Secreted RxLR effector protein PITG_22926 n=1 Tax=Phytophthora infestans (strain T30-4) TaxID=403677 RepID=RXLAD_PHYIT|nr:secreted RxLR effector peptide protein, putative [Phytophthora infestans T30-4]D0NNI8.1 RecName: Full=Secreted RxLR effector protein PITG_22926; Flags: Precursor [Phytophthora infestans T30-4]EEY62159.1 secreted RxLR effector peptide protein, putative [Phytophthora infestans T30-4]|eukprot:XP_002899190.1 secreted RxLR effector peptide protein, putative [Phytophthora infestans T30-4]
MRCNHTLCVVAITFLVSWSQTLSTPVESRRTESPLVRSVSATEERNIFSQTAEAVAKWGTTTALLNLGKTDDEVKKILGLEKLSGEALKAHSNYHLLDDFITKLRDRKVTGWLHKDTTTDEVWKTLQLDDLFAKLDAKEFRHSDELKTYVQYVKKLDDDIWNYKRASFEPDSSSPLELAVKIHIWAKAKRPSWHVLEMMGNNALKGSKNRKFYREYLLLIKGKKPIIDF